jgi:hypothetical protein
MSLKRQHEELDKETKQRIAYLNTVQQLRFNLKGEAREKMFLSIMKSPCCYI